MCSECAWYALLGRIIPCHNCGEDMSPSHICQEEPSEIFKCDRCEEVFNFKVELENHKQTIGECPKHFVCPVCNVDCVDLTGRWKHEFEEHPDSEVCLDYQAYLDFNSDLYASSAGSVGTNLKEPKSLSFMCIHGCHSNKNNLGKPF